jgi:hypothetical protein
MYFQVIKVIVEESALSAWLGEPGVVAEESAICVGLARTIYIRCVYRVYTAILAGKSPNIRCSCSRVRDM